MIFILPINSIVRLHRMNKRKMTGLTDLGGIVGDFFGEESKASGDSIKNSRQDDKNNRHDHPIIVGCASNKDGEW